MSYKFWSPEEVQRLKKDYPTTPNKKLADQMGRTVDSVKTKAYDYDLNKEYFGNTTQKEEVDLKEVYCNDCMCDPESCGEDVEECLKKPEAQTYIEGLKRDYKRG